MDNQDFKAEMAYELQQEYAAEQREQHYLDWLSDNKQSLILEFIGQDTAFDEYCKAAFKSENRKL